MILGENVLHLAISDHDYANAATIPKVETVTKPQNVISLEIQTVNVVIDLDEIKVNHLNEDQKMKLTYALELDQCECIKSTISEEKYHYFFPL